MTDVITATHATVPIDSRLGSLVLLPLRLTLPYVKFKLKNVPPEGTKSLYSELYVVRQTPISVISDQIPRSPNRTSMISSSNVKARCTLRVMISFPCLRSRLSYVLEPRVVKGREDAPAGCLGVDPAYDTASEVRNKGC